MLTLLLVVAGLVVMVLASILIGALAGRTVRHGEQQDRQTRHTDPHAAYWGREPQRPTPARTARHRGTHARQRPHWARTDRHQGDR
ncbi:hypothetical protein [Streptomyces sp. H27-H5]|uniref:hypothetical protein n=1 Tax=Streptomyces sp. H27-H5 TaxID=2996460 RepID=UPI00226ED068|nr:hypothetical protein [Streptomyces sp. H27-H5]MCY0959946.1 hypothetical protein [Streptomyces sp. H27-H5]